MVSGLVPSPGQFDHVISVVAKGSTLSWMDTTPEVTAVGYLVYALRGKPALVITPDKVAFQTTPANSPFANKRTDTLTAKIDADGTLQAHVESMDRGDSELYFRPAFRRWPKRNGKIWASRYFTERVWVERSATYEPVRQRRRKNLLP